MKASRHYLEKTNSSSASSAPYRVRDETTDPHSLVAYINAPPSLPVHTLWAVRSTRELTAKQRYVYGGRVWTRFLHSLCSEGDHIRASCDASRHWDGSDGRYIPTRLGTSASWTSADGDVMCDERRRREVLCWEGSGAVLMTEGPSQLE